jgi:hypothetical protein
MGLSTYFVLPPFLLLRGSDRYDGDKVKWERGAFELRFEKDEDVRERGLPKKK